VVQLVLLSHLILEIIY